MLHVFICPASLCLLLGAFNPFPELDGQVPGESVSAQPREMLLLNLGTNQGAKTWKKISLAATTPLPGPDWHRCATGQL